jgi:hypothetical protein
MSPSQGAVAPARENTTTSSTAGISASSVSKSAVPEFSMGPRRVGYGMPCAKCKTYYAANLNACPVCKATERVAVLAAMKLNPVTKAETTPDAAKLEEERERFLKEFKSQAVATSLHLGPTTASHCKLGENHRGSIQPAAVCEACHDQLQERVDVLEAVLHMEVKEAADIIYDAVWADPSDPSKTYQNAAQAILNELKKRSGITPVFGPLQPLQH